jgi:hypothetical protein
MMQILIAAMIPDSLWPIDWKRLLACITGSVDQELLNRNEYLAEENRILRSQIKGRLCLNDAERRNLAEIGQRLGRQALAEAAQIVRPETILAWHRRLVAKKFDSSQKRSGLGRPSTLKAMEELVLQIARGNRTWGYKRIAGALGNLGQLPELQEEIGTWKQIDPGFVAIGLSVDDDPVVDNNSIRLENASGVQRRQARQHPVRSKNSDNRDQRGAGRVATTLARPLDKSFGRTKTQYPGFV